MRQYITIFLLTAIFSCKNKEIPDTEKGFNDNLMVGEWRIDSSSNRHFSYDRLILLDDGNFYLFSGSNGGSLLTNGRKFGNSKLPTVFQDTLEISILDSNRICVSGGWSNIKDFYSRSDYGDYQDNLKKYLQADSLRSKTLGWWKLISSKMPVKLINYRGYYDKFTLNIREDGIATFYLENKLDSTVDYSYNVNPDGIDFNLGCIVGSDCKISFDRNGKMKLVLDRMGDTLLLEKLTEIK